MTSSQFEPEPERRLVPPRPFRYPYDELADPAVGLPLPPPPPSLPPPPPALPPGDDGDDGEPPDDDPRSPNALMDRLVGRAPQRPLERAGGSSRAIAEALDGREEPGPVLAVSYWWTVTRSPRFERALTAAGGHRPAAHRLMVPHASGTRFDLLVLVPDLAGPPRRVPFRISGAELTMAFERSVRGDSGIVRTFARLYPRVRRHNLAAALREVARATEFGVIIARAASEEQTSYGVPEPANGVSHGAGDAPDTTAGIVFQRDGAWWATTALHGVPSDTDDVWLDGRPGKVVRRHQVTDSCLIRIDGDFPAAPGAGRSVADRMVPAIGSAYFQRINEGWVRTYLRFIDPNVADDQCLFTSKVYTSPETQRGDSGTALINADNQIIGFAGSRTADGEIEAMSVWVWASQVLRSLEVHA